jgi:hypothetical protein
MESDDITDAAQTLAPARAVTSDVTEKIEASRITTPDPADPQESQHYQPLRTVAGTKSRHALSRAQSATSTKSIGRMRSNNGHGCAELDDSADEAEAPGRVNSPSKDPFEVSWDNDNDPFCPRSMSLLHKWTIVLIVGLGSLCV